MRVIHGLLCVLFVVATAGSARALEAFEAHLDAVRDDENIQLTLTATNGGLLPLCYNQSGPIRFFTADGTELPAENLGPVAIRVGGTGVQVDNDGEPKEFDEGDYSLGSETEGRHIETVKYSMSLVRCSQHDDYPFLLPVTALVRNGSDAERGEGSLAIVATLSVQSTDSRISQQISLINNSGRNVCFPADAISPLRLHLFGGPPVKAIYETSSSLPSDELITVLPTDGHPHVFEQQLEAQRFFNGDSVAARYFIERASYDLVLYDCNMLQQPRIKQPVFRRRLTAKIVHE